jgi:hypothetical protein
LLSPYHTESPVNCIIHFMFRRGKIWVYLAKSFTVALNHDSNIYYKLLETTNEEVEAKIKNDVDRSALLSYNPSEGKAISYQISDANKKKLFNILKAYAIYDHQVNYCQGIFMTEIGTNFILAVLISHIPSERCAFWTFVQIMYDKNWRDLCMDKVPKLMRMLDLFAEHLKHKLFEVYAYFDELGVKVS